MNLKNTQGVIFDMDGVLISSIDNMRFSWGKVCEKYNLSIPFSSYQKHIGKPFEDIMIALGVGKLLPNIKEDYFYFSRNSNIHPQLYEGVKELLTTLSKKGKKIGIITSKAKQSLDKIMEDTELKIFFEEKNVLAPPEHDHSLGKPNTYLGEVFMKENNLKNSEISYVGDMISDYEFAKKSGFYYIHNLSGYQGNIQIDSRLGEKVQDIKSLLIQII